MSRKRIEISDTRLENATSTVTAEITPEDDLRVMQYDGRGGVTAGYINHRYLHDFFRDASGKWAKIRKLQIVMEVEEDG